MLSKNTIIKKFIPTVQSILPIATQPGDDSFAGKYYTYQVRQSNAPYRQTVCLLIGSRPILNPLFDAGETSLLENLEFITGTTAVGFFTTEGDLVIRDNASDKYNGQAYVDCESRYKDRFACLYLLQN